MLMEFWVKLGKAGVLVVRIEDVIKFMGVDCTPVGARLDFKNELALSRGVLSFEVVMEFNLAELRCIN